MLELTPDVPERCPKCGETERHYWCRCGTLIKGTVCPMCDRTREDAMKRERADDSIPFACGTEVTPDGRVVQEGEVCLRRQLAAARAEAERLMTENERLYRRIERLEARAARQRVMLYRLQAAVERRNREERIEALRRAVYDETVERYMRECDAADDEAERWRKKYEALRAGVERVVQDLRKWTHAATRDWQQSGHHPYHDGASDAYYEAEQLVRLVLAEEGGDKRD